eukprot:SAG31_NODE_18728_length_625_cov_0.604563_1_plen_173_part_01
MALGGTLSPKSLIEMHVDLIELRCSTESISLIAWGHGDAVEQTMPIAPFGLQTSLAFKKAPALKFELVDKTFTELNWPDGDEMQKVWTDFYGNGVTTDAEFIPGLGLHIGKPFLSGQITQPEGRLVDVEGSLDLETYWCFGTAHYCAPLPLGQPSMEALTRRGQNTIRGHTLV